MKTYGGFLISQIRQLSGRTFEKILKEKGIDAFNGRRAEFCMYCGNKASYRLPILPG